MTLEQLDEHIIHLEEEGFLNADTASIAKASPGEAGGKVCEIFKKVKPVLEIVSTLWLVPKKWRTVIATFIVSMDVLCKGD